MSNQSEPSPVIKPDQIYEQLSEDCRALNAIFWQTPVIVMTLNGGLWFSISTLELSEPARDALLFFGAAADAVFIFALFRLRHIIAGLQKQIRAMDHRGKIGRDFQIFGAMAILLAGAAGGSIYAAMHSDAFFMPEDTSAGASCE